MKLMMNYIKSKSLQAKRFNHRLNKITYQKKSEQSKYDKKRNLEMNPTSSTTTLPRQTYQVYSKTTIHMMHLLLH